MTGKWIYSNFQMAAVAGPFYLEPELTGGIIGPFIELADWSTFDTETDNLIRAVDNNHNLDATHSTDRFRVRTLSNDLSVVSSFEVVHQGDFGTTPTNVYAADFVSGKYFCQVSNMGAYSQMNSSGSYEGPSGTSTYAPTAGAETAWAFAPQQFRWGQDFFARGGAWFARLHKSGSPSETNWDRLVKWSGFSAVDRVLPSAAILNVDGVDPSNFHFYVNPLGTEVYTLKTDLNWILKQYDGGLVYVRDIDISFAKPSETDPTTFAVLGDFLFVMHATRALRVWRISTETMLGEYVFASPPGLLAPCKILPHPTGRVFVQRSPNYSSISTKPTEIWSFRWADAVFFTNISAAALHDSDPFIIVP